MEQPNLVNVISLKGDLLHEKSEQVKENWRTVLQGYQKKKDPSVAVLKEMNAIQTIIDDPNILNAYTVRQVQTFIDDEISQNKGGYEADDLDREPAADLVEKLTSSYDCSGIDFSECVSVDDVRRTMYNAAGIEYTSPQKVMQSYHELNQLLDSNANVTAAMQNYEDLCHKAHCSIDNTGHLILAERAFSPSDMVPYYQSGRGMASLTQANQDELATMMGENTGSSIQDATGKTM